jgi:glutaredoxin
MTEKWVIISRHDCVWCERARELLGEKGKPFAVFNLSVDPVLKDLLKAMLPIEKQTVPQIFVDGYRVGGYKELVQYFHDDDLTGESVDG